MVMRWLLFAVLFPSVANASFMLNRSDWVVLNGVEKGAYLMGVFDGWTLEWVGDPNAPARRDMHTCAVELGLGAADFVKIVDTEYEDLESWKYGPQHLLITGLGKVCRDIYNRERVKRGEEPFKPKSD
jgi:hypothetical protein